MAKKDLARSHDARVSGGADKAPTRTALARQLAAASQDLNSVYESEHKWRLDLLKANEEISRDTVDIEVEIRRLQQEELQLKARLAEFEKGRDKLAAEDKELTRQHDQLERERDDLQGKVDSLSEAVKELTRENDSLAKDVAKLKVDVDRLEGLRKEYLAQIAKFRSQKAKLVEE
jgi:chromosome segregation ATPase